VGDIATLPEDDHASDLLPWPHKVPRHGRTATSHIPVNIRGAWAEEPGIDGWVWDGASGHKGADMQAIEAPQVVQPPYAPEPNPVARFFQELRRALGDRRPNRRPWNRS